MDFYVILGLERSASSADVKRAYRRLARKYHPDINPGDRAAERVFRQISEAYATLVDPDRRRQYDSGAAPPAPSEPTLEFEGFDFSIGAGSSSIEATFSELFAEVFGQPETRSAARAEAGAD